MSCPRKNYCTQRFLRTKKNDVTDCWPPNRVLFSTCRNLRFLRLENDLIWWNLPKTLKLTAKAPENRPSPQKDSSLPNTPFIQLGAVSFREGTVIKHMCFHKYVGFFSQARVISRFDPGYIGCLHFGLMTKPRQSLVNHTCTYTNKLCNSFPWAQQPSIPAAAIALKTRASCVSCPSTLLPSLGSPQNQLGMCQNYIMQGLFAGLISKTIHNFLQDILHQHLTLGHWVSRTELHIVAGNTLGIGNPQFHGNRVIYNSSPTMRCLERLQNPIRNVICAAIFPKRKKHLRKQWWPVEVRPRFFWMLAMNQNFVSIYVCWASKQKGPFSKKWLASSKNHPAFEISTNFVGTKLSV